MRWSIIRARVSKTNVSKVANTFQNAKRGKQSYECADLYDDQQ